MKRAEFQSLAFEGTIDVALELQKSLEASRLATAALRKELAELGAGAGEPPEKHGAQRGAAERRH